MTVGCASAAVAARILAATALASAFGVPSPLLAAAIGAGRAAAFLVSVVVSPVF